MKENGNRLLDEKKLQLVNITKEYNSKARLVIALDHLSYDFQMGKFYAIMGHSGSGKSTLISILGLIERPTSGSYKIDGQDMFSLNDLELSRFRNQKIGFIFQNFYLDEHLKAYENVMLPMLINHNYNKTQRKERAICLLKKMKLDSRLEHFPREMSGGEQQRVAIARALANNPDIILADEPTGNLDEKNEKIIFEELRKLANDDKLVIVVSHSSKVKDYADIVINLKDGGIIK